MFSPAALAVLAASLVQYKLPANSRNAGQTRLAVKVQDFGTCANLQVFVDGTNDNGFGGDYPAVYPGNGTAWVTSALQGDEPGQWRPLGYEAPALDDSGLQAVAYIAPGDEPAQPAEGDQAAPDGATPPEAPAAEEEKPAEPPAT